MSLSYKIVDVKKNVKKESKFNQLPMKEQVVDETIVVELGLTDSQLKTLRWVLICWLGQYEDNEGSVYKNDVRAMSDALEGI